MTSQQAETPKVIQVADGMYVRQEIDNMLWADMGGAAVVVDALEHAEKADEVLSELNRTLDGTPVAKVINTHVHYDHIALNETFRKTFGAEIVNQQTKKIPAEGLEIPGDRRSLRMVPAGGLHTREDCIVWFPDDRVLCTGDLFGWGLIPLTRRLSDDSAARLLETYRQMIDLDPQTVMPGHGPLCTRAELERFVSYLRWLSSEAVRAHDAGKSEAEILSALPAPEDMADWWRFTEWKHDSSASAVVQAVKRGWRGL